MQLDMPKGAFIEIAQSLYRVAESYKAVVISGRDKAINMDGFYKSIL